MKSPRNLTGSTPFSQDLPQETTLSDYTSPIAKASIMSPDLIQYPKLAKQALKPQDSSGEFINKLDFSGVSSSNALGFNSSSIGKEVKTPSDAKLLLPVSTTSGSDIPLFCECSENNPTNAMQIKSIDPIPSDWEVSCLDINQPLVTRAARKQSSGKKDSKPGLKENTRPRNLKAELDRVDLWISCDESLEKPALRRNDES
jgi:hypothetical protein